MIEGIPSYLKLIEKKENDAAAFGGNGGGGEMDARITNLERDVASIKTSLDWARGIVTMILTVMLAGFSLLTIISFNVLARIDAQSSRVDGITAKITDEFRALRQEQSAQVSAIANAITATKQQAPQVILVPAPAPERPSALGVPPIAEKPKP